ncbi:ERI1 exoribonuclease 2-like isoform X2 [Halichondria panicea]|uniref:ERI1 exoribonuclease 2-like isoform X2 n=1 Tax=Halichondria panicea TaxID=6063 RepID=UPI00312B417E
MPSSKTKELARKLGIIGPKRKQTCQTDEGAGDVQKKKRTVEFPAVLLDVSNGDVVSIFQKYVLPIEQPTLSDFCKQLTGITQEQVDNGIPVQTCLYLFKQWVMEMQQKTGLVMMEPGKAYSLEQQLCSFVTWSDWDLGVCLYYECKRKQIKTPTYFNQWVNIRALYKTFYERKPSGLKGSLEDLGIPFVGNEHSGIDDARNTAKLCYRMVRDGCKLNITKCIDKAVSIKKPPACLAIPLINPSIPAIQRNSVKSITCTHSTTDSSPKNVTSEHIESALFKAQRKKLIVPNDPEVKDSCVHIDSVVKPLSQAERHNSWDSLDDKPKTITVVDRSPHLKKQDIVHPLKSETGLQVCKHFVEQTPTRLVSHISPVTLLPSTCTTQSSNKIKIPIEHHKNRLLQAFTRSPTCEDTPPPKLTYHTADVKKGCSNSFKTPSSRMNKTHSNSCSSSSITPSNSVLSVALGHKVTPPVCDCGRRTKKKLVAKAGPNEGKPFYVCPNSCGSNKSRGCGFFKWEVVQKENIPM